MEPATEPSRPSTDTQFCQRRKTQAAVAHRLNCASPDPPAALAGCQAAPGSPARLRSAGPVCFERAALLQSALTAPHDRATRLPLYSAHSLPPTAHRCRCRRRCPPPIAMPAAVPPSAFCAELLCPPQQFAAVAALLQRERLAGVNLPNKSKGELPQLLERCRAARAAMPAVPLCCHYSICQNW